MMTLVRWHRARDMHTMRHNMNRMVHQFFRAGLQDKAALRRGSWTPAIDLCEGDEGFTLTAELPGFSKDDVEVEIKDNRLTLRGERKRETDVKEAQYHRVERAYGAFQRSIRLPAKVDADKAEAVFKDGVLKLTLPKAAEAKPKPISITV
jgi:HSP20 family protein